MNIVLQKMFFSGVWQKADEFYGILSDNRTRLEPWFWWANKKVTPNKFCFVLFIFFYLCETKGKEIFHKLNFKSLYDEQFLVYSDEQFVGMVGLDNIDNVNNNAELWGWVSKTPKSAEIVDGALKIIEDYCIENKKLTSLYAKTQLANRPVRVSAVRHGFIKDNIEYGVRISKRNPNISDIITWTKQLVK